MQCRRPEEHSAVLNHLSRSIVVVQLQGHLFFGNATLLAAEVEKMLRHNSAAAGHIEGNDSGSGGGVGTTRSTSSSGNLHTMDAAAAYSAGSGTTNLTEHIRFIILDFTLVVAIDSSAAETILKMYKTCKHNNVRLCYCAGSSSGFPCAFPITESIEMLNKETIVYNCTNCNKCGAMFTFDAGKCSACHRKESFRRNKWVYQSHSLEGALAWCEDVLIAQSCGANVVASSSSYSAGYGSTSSAEVRARYT